MVVAKFKKSTKFNPVLIPLGMEADKEYVVRYISMGQSYTTVYLEDYDWPLNSIKLDFFENGEPLDIYGDPRFNPYLH